MQNLLHLPDKPAGVCWEIAHCGSSRKSHSPAGRAGRGLAESCCPVEIRQMARRTPPSIRAFPCGAWDRETPQTELDANAGPRRVFQDQSSLVCDDAGLPVVNHAVTPAGVINERS